MKIENVGSLEPVASNIARSTESFFSQDGPLKEAEKFGGRPYEYREQQVRMATRVAEAFEENTNLCVEAPTGVGKSFAYLVPAIHYAMTQKHPVLVTTETINLQEQLIEKDLPILRNLMNVDFKIALAKGRTNYLCLRRLRLATGDLRQELLPFTHPKEEALALARWAQETEDGSRSSIDFKLKTPIWEYVCCEGSNCSGPKCGFFKTCFYWKARRKWDSAHIIVANHALFFTDLKIKELEKLESTLLPPYSAVIFDEAHTMEDSAASHLGLRLTGAGIHHFLSRLFDPEKGKGLLLRKGEEALELRKKISDTLNASDQFFDMLRGELINRQDTIYRVKDQIPAPDLLTGRFAEIAHSLNKYIQDQDDEDYKTELKSQLLKCEGYRMGIHDFLHLDHQDHVYWVETEGQAETGNVVCQSAPLMVHHMLRDILYTADFPVILTSATLAVCQTMDYYRSRSGYTGGGELVLDSPFDFQRQVQMYIARSMPDPKDDAYHAALVGQIKHFIEMTHGKAFVLFTSYHALRRCAQELEGFFLEKRITLLIQGEDKTRSAMLREFREDTDSVIFGTTSFWTGVDVPGEALSNVIITKLPFSVPSHPLIEARLAEIEQAGGNPFMEYSLPEAVLKLKQGAGRLVRSKNDTGYIVILDNRVLTKRYGSFFIKSLPQCPVNVV